MDHAAEMVKAAGFLDRAIGEIAGFNDKHAVRVLDFGCGAGDMLKALGRLGYDAYGCDIAVPAGDSDRIRKIEQRPYRIPYADNFFDVVTSTSVLEHAKNPEEYMPEICRVLKPGGYAMHILPAKWYLPSEPHMFVPLVNLTFPYCPTWWLALWALLGVRNTLQQQLGWRETVAMNRYFYDNQLIYLSGRQYNALSRRFFGEHFWPMDFFVANSYGGFAALARRVPLPKFWSWVSRNFRMAFLVQRKTA